MTQWQGEVCKRCLRRNCIGFQVSDEIWNEVAGGRWNVLCPTCFDEEAELAGVAYRLEQVWPASWSDWKGGAMPNDAAPPQRSRLGAVAGVVLRLALIAEFARRRFAPVVGRVVARRPARAVGAPVPGVAAVLLAVLHGHSFPCALVPEGDRGGFHTLFGEGKPLGADHA